MLVWGKVEYEDVGVKLCASNIKVVRELTWSEVLFLCNSGDNNTGYGNSGDNNSGDCNTGNHNSGDCNIGDFNTGNWNAGIFNTGACEYAFAFNQLVKKQDLECLPSIPFLRFKLVEWIPEKHMLPEEKEQHPKYATAGGYLKKYDYKEAFRKSFEEARRKPDWPEQLEKLKSLPNFDAKIFEEISGITAEELTGSTVEKLTTKPKRKREKSTKGA